MSKPSVLHLITRFFHGGAEKTTVNTLEALATASNPYDLRLGVGAGHDQSRLVSLADCGIETVVFDSIRHYNPVTSVFAVGAVAKYLRREEIDLIHTHSTEAGIIGRFAARLADTPVVIHEIHGDPIAADRNSLLNATIVRLEQLAAANSTALIVKSEHIRQIYLDRGIGTPEQYHTIYHGVDLDRFRKAKPTRGSDIPTLLFVGRLTDGKGLFDLLDATERLQQSTELELLVAGNGPLSDTLAERVESQGLADAVMLLGYREDISQLMASADVLVLPSYREGTPRVITEALAAGTPVVATDIAGIPEQVEDGATGYLVEPGDIQALTDRLYRLLTEKKTQREMGNRAARSVEKFDIETAKAAYRQMYKELLGDHL